MKQLLASLLLAIIIGFSVSPHTALAIEADEPEFEAFLKDIDWEEKDYIDYLESKDWYLEDFWSVDELGTPLSEESIQPVLADFDLSREELNELLIENGDIAEGQDVLDVEWILFSEELYDTVDIYLNGWEGTPIDDDNLQELLDLYEFESKEALEAHLNEYGESIDDYEYIEDLDFSIEFYSMEDGDYYEEDMDFYGDDFSELYSLSTGSAFADSLIVLSPLILEMLFFQQ
ncbi:processed acidic surface protein [Oceanobacillus sp. FSL K6-2867]|uniref:processed acidic surface protein n=1 Tax=Oceanobacillus sp. FSL K6-2867 TaxID=2954748 RepID=UPI0030D8696B